VADPSAVAALKRAFIGAPIPSQRSHQERLSRPAGLAVLASDALSSVAYATEEILRTLLVAGAGALWLGTPLGLVIAGLLLVVAVSYRQTIHAYPGGGGSYVVARENLGPNAGLTAAAALLIDYVMTVAVSIAAGVAAVVSVWPPLGRHRVLLSLACLGLVAALNLRGTRESGRIFSVPTFFFLGAMGWLLAAGTFRVLIGETPDRPAAAVAGTASLSALLVLRAFANGCTAMTGVEAISNGVPAFRPPESRNAAAVLMTMAVLCVGLFLGVTLLAHAFHVRPAEAGASAETVVSQLARAVFDGGTLPYLAVQAATMLILVLAANTSFADLPRLASILARERFMPRQFMNQGDRLAFSNGIVALALAAGILLAVFGGDTHALIPLYMVGAFLAFTLSQAGMVRKWRRERPPGWRRQAALNGIGATLTGVVLLVVLVSKFTEGAWMVLAAVPLLMLHFHAVRRHYDGVARELSLQDYVPGPQRHNTVLVPIGGVQRAVLEALRYARTLSPDVRAVYVDADGPPSARVREEWSRWGGGVPLVVLDSPYRSLLEPLVRYVEQVDAERSDDFVTVVLPEFVPRRWWHHLLHNQRALLIKAALLFRPGVVVTSVPIHLRA
jgi:amino acid transporter